MALVFSLRAGSMKVLITGASGLVGSALVPKLHAAGHEVVRLVRRPPAQPDEIEWRPDSATIDGTALEGCDAVVHLAGENIAGRWTAAKKRRIRESRVEGTRVLCTALAGLARPPGTFVGASAIGYYGDRGDDVLDDDSPPGTGFLPQVCVAWEAAADPLRETDARVVHLRIGVVLSRRGGALAKMLLPFRLGLGGVIGGGRQFWSWIALDDVVGAISHALSTDSLAGAANAVAPQPVTNREFTKTLGRVLKRPTVFPMPAFAARLAFGEMAEALMLASARVVPRRLESSGYAFEYPALEDALRHVLHA
ncbi:MAG TPA: TIGR01777 family oxidoreductase [Planctomycetaceae bacterium]|nr:TIGR01777 family oxidoreductase [Planctomycetaceae bacterium]